VRIAHVIDYFHTDVGYQEYYLAKCMAEAGHRVRVVTSHLRQHTVAEAGPDEAAGADALTRAGVEVVRLPARQLGHDRAWLHGLERALDEFRPDAVHCHGAFAPTTVRVARHKARLRYRLLVDNHIQRFIAPGASTLQGRVAYGAYRTLAGRLLRRSVDHWVAIGPYEGEFLADLLGLTAGEVELVPLGFDPAVFGPDEAGGRAERDRRGWDDDLVVAVTGKIHRRKRPDLVAAACATVARDRPVRLVVAGTVDGESRRAVERAAGPLTAAGRVEFLPMLGRHDLSDLYRAADVVVFARLPSISIYEAAGTGARVLVGRDEFAEWLAGMDPAVVPVEPEDLAPHLARPHDRTADADAAARVFAWGTLGERFVARYRGRDGAGSGE